jgi:hypothetical protein
VFAPWVWLLHFRVETRHVHAERHLAKAGVARCKGGVSPPGAKRRASAAKVCTSEARKIGEALVAARGAAPTRKAWFPYEVRVSAREL